jgi:hypothetical protein
LPKLAFALGPNYNKPWDLFDDKELKVTLDKIREANKAAKHHAPWTTKVESALIDAIQVRVPKGLDEAAFCTCNEEYAKAMEAVYEQFSDDLDVASLYADSLMNLSAWALWDLETGEPTKGARSLEAKNILEKALQQAGAHKHPGVPHLYIHLMEMSKRPEAALNCADRLRKLAPDAGHLVLSPRYEVYGCLMLRPGRHR